MNWLRNFMYGRNGVDHLSVLSVVLGLVFSVIASFTFNPILRLIPLLPYGYAFFRVLSKNIPKRQAENRKFINIHYTLKGRINRLKIRHSDKTHKYYTCPSCKASLRVPKGKGRIVITCPRCKNEITKKT
ncbi:MAG: hypothetical protein GX257_01610 [Clostridiales bacterium]|jgi:hypothetical protein|nr:hypothetical protein [Clostridiales bacterium]